MHPLVDEAMKKAAVAWLSRPGQPVWCLWIDGALYVVHGPGEQPAPALDAPTVDVTVRGDHGGQILTWPATVSTVEPGSPEWDRIVPQLAGKRLNASGAAEQTAACWAAECVVSRLDPVPGPVTAGADLPDGSGAAPPLPTPAARRPRNPFRLHRVRR